MDPEEEVDSLAFPSAPDYLRRERQFASAQAISAFDDDPDEAARAQELSKATGAPASIIHSNLEEFEKQHRASLVSQLINNSAYLREFMVSHPLAASISNDDLGQLDAVSESLGKLGSKSILGTAFEAFTEPYKGGAGSWMLSRPEDIKFFKQYPELYAISQIFAAELAPLEAAAKFIPAAAAGLSKGIAEGIRQTTGSERAATAAEHIGEAAMDPAIWMSVGLPTMGMPKPVEIMKHNAEIKRAATAAKPWIQAGKDPPVGIDPLIDKAIVEQSKVDLDNLDGALKEAQKSATRERSPEIFADYLNLHPQGKIGISADAVRELYKDKPPSADDGILGWIPDLAQQLDSAEPIGGFIEVSRADWLARVDPGVAKELRDHIRVRPEGVTLEEAKALEVKRQEPEEENFLVGYHGTGAEPFAEFDPKSSGARGSKPTGWEEASFFSENPNVASSWAPSSERSRIAKVKIDLTNAEIYDLRKLWMKDPTIREEAIRGNTPSYYKQHPNEFEDHRQRELEHFEELERQRLYHEEELPKQIREDDSFGLTPEQIEESVTKLGPWKVPYGAGLVDAVIKRAKAAGRDVAVIENVGESSGNRQIAVLNPKAIRPFYTSLQTVEAIREATGLKPLFDEGHEIKALRLKKGKSFLPTEEIEGLDNKVQAFKITDETGRRVGDLELRETPDKKGLYIDWIGSVGTAEEMPNKFGPKLIRDLFRQVKEQFPEAETLFGGRVSGAREQAGTTGVVKVDLTKFDERTLADFAKTLRGGKWYRFSEDLEAYIKPTALYTENERKIVSTVNEVLNRIVPQGVESQSAHSLDRGGGAYIQYRERLPILLWALDSHDPIGTARHEAIHHLRRAGFFTENEWGVLEQAAREGDWVKNHRIDQRYKYLDTKGRLEEAIAEQYGKVWAKNPENVKSAVARVFEKLHKLFVEMQERLAEALGLSKVTADDLFHKVESGEIGSREGAEPINKYVFRPKREEIEKGSAEALAEKKWSELDEEEKLRMTFEEKSERIQEEDPRLVQVPFSEGNFGKIDEQHKWQDEQVAETRRARIQRARQIDKMARGEAIDVKREEPELPGMTRIEDRELLEKTKDIGMTKQEYELYIKNIERRNAEDVAWQKEKAIAQAKKQQTKEWRENRAGLRKEVANDLRDRPDFAADGFLRAGVLHGEALKEKPRLEISQLTKEQQEALPRTYYGKKGMDPDDVAELFGHQSGDTLIQHLSELNKARGEAQPKEFFDRLVDAETDRQMEAKYGDLPENILKEAMEHVISPTQIDILSQEWMALAIQAKLEIPLKGKDLKAALKEMFGQTPIGNLSVQKFLGLAGKAWRNLQVELLKDYPSEAFIFKQQQLLSSMMANESVRLDKEIGQFERIAKRFSKREVEGIPPEYTNFIHNILMRTGNTVRRSVQDLQAEIAAGEHKNLKDFVESKRSLGYDLPVADFLYDESFRKGFEDLTAEEFRAVHDSIKSLVKEGRSERKIIKGGEEFDRAEVMQKLVDSVTSLPALEQRIDIPQGVISKNVKTYLAASLNLESIFNRFDRNNPRGVFNQFIVRLFTEHINNLAAEEKEFSKMMRGLEPIDVWNKKVENPLFVDPRTGDLMPMSRKNLLAVLQNVGNPGNFEGLLRGYHIPLERGPELMKWLFDNTTKEDWERAQGLGKVFAEAKARNDRMRREQSGIAPEAIELWTIKTPWGEMEGWYHPITYDRSMPQDSAKLIGPDVLEYPTFVRATPSAGFTKTRTNYTGPFQLDFESVPYRLQEMLHDTNMRPVLVELGKIFRDKDFRAAMDKHYGKEYTDLLHPWLESIAKVDAHMDAADRVAVQTLEFFRQNIISHLVGLNPSTLAKHTMTAAMNSLTEVGAVNYFRWQFALLGKAETGESNWQFAIRNSQELQRRDRNFVETIKGADVRVFGNMASSSWKDVTAGFEGRTAGEGIRLAGDVARGKYMSLRESMMYIESYPLAFFDKLSAVPTWLAQYEKSRKSGADHGAAVFEAERAVRRAHGSTAITNRPKLMRGGALAQSLASFYGFFSHMFQRTFELAWAVKGALRGDPYYVEGKTLTMKKGLGYSVVSPEDKATKGYVTGLAAATTLAGMVVSYNIFPAFVEETVQPMHGTEHDSWPAYLAKALVLGESGKYLYIRDFVHAAIDGGDVSSGLFGTMARSMLNAVRDFRPSVPLNTTAKRQKFIRDQNAVFGMLTGLTNSSVPRMAMFSYNVQTGKEHPKTTREIWRGVTTGSSVKRH